MKTLFHYPPVTTLTIAILCAVVLLAGCEKEVEIAEAPLRSVRYYTVPETNGNRVRTFTGVSRSAQEAKLSFKVTGTLTSVDVAVGDRIETGQQIASLDRSTYSLQLQQSQADLARSQAEKRNADASYTRTKSLYENRSASRTELDSTRAAAESATAQVRAASRSVELARLNLDYTRLISKDDCSVASTSADVGENVSPGQEILLVNCGDTLQVDVSIPENLISSFEQGQVGTIRFDSLAGKEFSGQVVEVGVSATGTTFPVSLTIAESAGIRAGLAAEVDFVFDKGESYPAVPVSAVSEDQQGRFIYLLDPGSITGQGVVKRQPVSVGDLTASGLEIMDGIKPGDRVITAGVSVIRDGLVVKAL